MTAPETPGRLEAAWQYLEHVAGIVLLGVDEAGTIRWSNRHARDLGGLALAGEPIDRLFLNFRNAPIWTELRLAPGRVCLLNARTISGLPETYYVTCVLTSEGPLVFGQTDAVEQARLRREVLALSREAAEMTRELARRNGELAERNEEKNRFLGMATHDLRRPVDLVLGCVEMLLDELATGLDEEHLRLLRTIHTATRGMARVIDDFLDVAAIDSGRLGLDAARCRVEHLLAEAIALNAAPARSRGIRIEAAPTLATIVLHADGPKIGQVFENLLSNAVEHAPDGSTVRVECRREGCDIRFEVVDRGPGIPADRRADLFADFTGTGGRKRNGEKSIGLGLALSRRVVEAHGGRMVVRDPEDGGACVGFLLPRTLLVAGTGEEAPQ